MSTEAPERRRIVVLAPDRRFDIMLGLERTLRECLLDLGYRFDDGRWVVLDHHGRAVSLGTPVAELLDGALLAIVDPEAPDDIDESQRPVARGAAAVAGADLVLPFVAIGVLGVVLTLAAAPDTAPTLRLVCAGVFALGALLAGIRWVRRTHENRTIDAVLVFGPVALAFAAGFLVVPAALDASLQLAIIAGLLGITVVTTAMLLAGREARMRGALGVLVVISLGVAAVWLVGLFVGVGLAQSAAVCLGAVPIALRALPASLLNLPPGYAVDHQHFVTSRWTVRGVIPESPGAVLLEDVRPVVDASSARLIVGTVALSLVAALSAPLAVGVFAAPSPLVLGGAIGLWSASLLALLTLPRSSGNALARWSPRIAAAVVAVVAVPLIAASPALTVVLIAGGALLASIVIAFILVPIGRGLRSIAFSRIADIGETLGVVLSLPAALLAADAIEVVRRLMS